jgi:hypothetical protein
MAGLPEATGVLPHNTNRPHSSLNKLTPTEFAEHVSSGIGSHLVGDDQPAKAVDVSASSSLFTLTSIFMSNSSSTFPR